MRTKSSTRFRKPWFVGFASRSTLALLSLASVAVPGCASLGKSEPLVTQEQRQSNLASFDQVWTTIRDKHWDPTLGGRDWDAIGKTYRAQVEQARTASESRQAMRAMLRELGQSHFAILPADVYRDLDADDTSGESGDNAGDLGLEVRVLDGVAVVTAVRPGPAREAGVKPGWIVAQIDDRELAPILDRIAQARTDGTRLDYYLTGAVLGRLSGDAGTDVSLVFLDGANEKVPLRLTRQPHAGPATTLGFLPKAYVRFESRWVAENIGYIAFNLFLDPANTMESLRAAVEEFRDGAGIVLDLRGNGGGLGAMAMGVSGWFLHEANRRLGTMTMRSATLHFVVLRRPWTYDGRLAILVDGLTASTSEILAGGLKDLGRARVFGTRTAGAALPSMIERLPNGDGFQYAFANYESYSGAPLEGKGVVPDEEIRLTRAALLAGADPVLEAAVRWVQSGGALTAQ